MTRNLTFAAAQREARAGRKIKRKEWAAWLKLNGSGTLEFQLRPDVAKDVGINYSPTKIDREARDWQSY